MITSSSFPSRKFCVLLYVHIYNGLDDATIFAGNVSFLDSHTATQFLYIYQAVQDLTTVKCIQLQLVITQVTESTSLNAPLVFNIRATNQVVLNCIYRQAELNTHFIARQGDDVSDVVLIHIDTVKSVDRFNGVALGIVILLLLPLNKAPCQNTPLT